VAQSFTRESLTFRQGCASNVLSAGTAKVLTRRTDHATQRGSRGCTGVHG
jgi:hypothetical protein